MATWRTPSLLASHIGNRNTRIPPSSKATNAIITMEPTMNTRRGEGPSAPT